MSTQSTQSVVPSSSGYPSYPSMLNSPIFGEGLVHRYKMKAITTEITGNKMMPSEINKSGTEVVLYRAPEAEIRTYQKNQPLQHSDLATDTIHMVISRAIYWSLKIDQIDLTQVGNIQAWINAFKDDAAHKIDTHISRELLLELPVKASPHNKGVCAGIKTGSWNLGQIGKPIQLRPDNMAQIFAMLEAVLVEQECASKDVFIILPYAAKFLMYHPTSPLYSASVSGLAKSSVLMTSEMFPDFLGFKTMFAHNMPVYTDPITGDTTYTIIAGDKNATAFITQMNKSRVIDTNHETWDSYWQALQVYDFDVIQPENLAVAYVTIKNQVSA